MNFYVTIDRGNTAIKAALWDEGKAMLSTARGDATLPAGELVKSLVCGQVPEGQRLHTIVYCSVCASDRADDLDSLAPLCVNLIELNASTTTGMEIAYRTPGTLGADRIAAALGAIALAGDSRPLLVADMGTAVTYDHVMPGRRYAGGNIAPGIDMRLRALAAFTDTLPAVNPTTGEAPMWGTTTAEAMRSGAIRGVVAELDYYLRAAGEGAMAVITGGSAALLHQMNILTFDYIYDPYLVHKGLFSIIKDEN